jgi:hypothetical protein
MSMPDYEPPAEIWERQKLGLELRQKYELYFVSLAFTLAAASVQTATHTGPKWRLIVEVVAWVLLSGAGIVGLWRLGKLWLREVGVAELQSMGFGALGAAGSSRDKELERLEKGIRKFGSFQYWIFITGFAAVGVSRAILLLCG